MKKSKFYPLYFLVPIFLVYGLFYLLPITLGEVYAFTDWNIYKSDIQFIGFENFKQMFMDSTTAKTFWRSISNTLYFAFATLIISNIIALLLALALNKDLKTKGALRLIYYIPTMLCPLAVGLIFSSIYNPNYGLINSLLRSIGLESLTQQWLADPKLAMDCVVVAGIWKRFGMTTLIYLAGLQGIPKEYLEAAAIDGSSAAQKFFHITLPLLISSVTINMFLGLVEGLKVFDFVISLTKGGPGTQTQVLATMVYKELASGRYGAATAYELVLNVIIAILGFAMLILMKKREVEL